MKYLYLVCRILLGVFFMFFGLNAFHPMMHMEMPPASTPPGMFMSVMGPSGWMHHVAVLQFIGGLLVLLGGTAPLGLVILGPIIVNILLFHILLTGGAGIGGGIIATVLELILIYAYRANFTGIFTYKAKPTA